jgi:hypothetical protein
VAIENEKKKKNSILKSQEWKCKTLASLNLCIKVVIHAIYICISSNGPSENLLILLIELWTLVL